MTRVLAAFALLAWMTLLAFMLLSPSAAAPTSLVQAVARIAEGLGVPSALAAIERVEFGLNVVAFVPASFLSALVWPRLTWRDWTAYAFLASFLVEVAQALVLIQRSATHSDVVANTLGGLVGAVLGVAIMRIYEAMDAGSEGGTNFSDRTPTAQQDQQPG